MTSSQTAHQYDTLFYQYQREGSLRSARVVLPLIVPKCSVKSMLDVGCGAGAWLSVAKSMGLEHVAGVDGDYVDRSMLLIDASHFSPRDISKPFDTGRTYDLVQCLEVAEHVPTAASATLVANIVRHGPLVLFSAAVPGQGGEDHINEQPYGYWRDLFAAHGYRLFDCVRSHVAGKLEVEPWYRYNLMVFAHDSIIASLPADIKKTRIADGAAIPDVSPAMYRLRKAVLASLPGALVSKLAVWKHRQAVRAFRQPG
jgi:SAM-dependent methyltransferase